jgi:tetratricopeptide (TPR) repeat protein
MRSICSPPGLRKWWKRLEKLPRYERLVPEVLFQAIYECIGVRLHPFFDILRLAQPNPLHAGLTRFCAAHGIPIVTTNFDLLLESSAPDPVQVLHLHGDLGDPEQMVVRINQVGRGIVASAAQQFQQVVAGKTVCFVGYSGNDTDVLLALKAARPQRLLWLVRSDSDWAWTNIPRFDQTVCPVLAACGDLGDLVAQISSAVIADPGPGTARGSGRQPGAARDRIVRAWSKGLSRVDRLACLAATFYLVEEYRACVEVALEGASLTRDPAQTGRLLMEAANALRIIGDFAEAEALARKAVSVAGADPYRKAIARNSLGLILLEKTEPEPARAAQAFEQSLRILHPHVRRSAQAGSSEAIPGLYSRIQNNLGLACNFTGEMEKSIRAFRESLYWKRKNGDLLGMAQTYVNGSLAYYQAGDFNLAYQWRRRALALIEKYGLDYREAYLYRRMGTIAAGQGRLRQSLRHLERALELYGELGDAPFDEDLTRRAIDQVRVMMAERSAAPAASRQAR